MHALPLLRCSPFAIAAATTRLIDSNWSCLRDRHLLLLLVQDGRDDDDHDDDHCSLKTLINNHECGHILILIVFLATCHLEETN